MPAKKEGNVLASAEFDFDRPGFIWHWWLARAKADGSGLKRWQAWIWWCRQRTAQARILAIVKVLRGVLEAPLEAWGGVSRYGDKTQRVYGVSRKAQFKELLILRWRFGTRPESYYKFQVFRADRIGDARHYLEECGQLLQAVLRKSPPRKDDQIFLSKGEFRRWCLEKEVPTVSNLLEISEGRVVFRSDQILPECDLFVKPANWSQGKGATLWRCIQVEGKTYYASSEDLKLTASELEEFVCSVSRNVGRPYLVQPAVRNHYLLKDYTNGSLATVRLMTVRGQGEAARPLMAALRMPTGSAIADNFDLGGVAAPVGLDSGECGVGIRKKGELPTDIVNVHPDTGKSIGGLVVPGWRECIALTCKAHDLVDAEVPVIGWDVAVLDDGPILIEANRLPCGNLAQMPGGVPLGSGAFAQVISGRLKGLFLSS